MPHRYFTRELADGRAALTGSDAHHLADVMRAKLGEEVVLCGPDGLEYLGTVTSIEPGRVEFSVTDGTTSKAEPDCTVTLFAGYPKQGKLEEVIRHSVELGVTGIVPFFSRYCVAAPKKEDAKNERYNRIAAEATGINVTKYKLMAFITSAVFAGMGGVLYALNFSTLAAKKFDYNTSILVLVFVVLGGIGSIRGSIIAATLLTILPEVLRAFSDYRMLVYAVVLIAVMLATNSPFLSVRLQRVKALVRRGKTNPGKEGEAA